MHAYLIVSSNWSPPKLGGDSEAKRGGEVLAKENPDTLHIHPDPSIGIDEVRQIQHFLSRKPLGGKNTVVIHQAEKLTLPAQHALLKTLEEPPGNSEIYLITSFPDTLIPTILSRVQIISSPHLSSTSYPSYIPDFLSARVGDRLKLLDAQSFTRETALTFLNEIEYYVHNVILSERSESKDLTRTTELIYEARKFLKSNCNVKLTLDHLALNLN